MVQRTKRQGDVIPDVPGLLRALGTVRDKLTDAHRVVSPSGPAYHALSMVTASIDALATFVTGQRDYFALKSHGIPEGPVRYAALRKGNEDA